MEDIVSKIKEFVSLYDLLDLCDPPVSYDSRERECQINCPFHGADLGPSARIYPDTNSMYCWACTKSWDVIDFWAEINGWTKSDGKLDVGRSIKDLSDRFSLREKRSDWKKSLFKSLSSVSVKSSGYSGVDTKERLHVLDSYSWMISKKVSNIPVEDRKEAWNLVKKAWDDIDSIDLASKTWKKDLSEWMKVNRSLANKLTM